MIKIKEALEESLKKLNKETAEDIGPSTGFKALDRCIGGLSPGKLIVLGARPGMGKSSLALQMATSVAKETMKPVAYFSFEMLYGEISLILLSLEAKIERRKFKTKTFEANDLKKISLAINTLSMIPLYIEDNPGIDLDELMLKCLKMKQEDGLSMVVIDYVQLLPKGDIIKRLKTLAVELNIPVVVISQLERTKRKDPRPWADDLRDIPHLTTEVDLILLIHRDDYYDPKSSKKGIAEIIISKNRAGNPGTVALKWIGALTHFEDLV